MDGILGAIITPEFWFAVVRITTPILFPAFAILITDRAGVVNIAAEGQMLQAALWGVLVSAWTGCAWIGLLGAVVSAMCIAVLFGFFTLKLGSNLLLTGIALNIFSSGSTILVLYTFTGHKGISAGVPSLVLPHYDIPGVANIPFLGGIVSGHHVLTYVAFVSVLILYYLLYRTPFGLRLRAVGEHPQAVASAGINVNRVKMASLLLGGLFAGLGGAFLSMGYMSWFTREMTAGRGWIGLVAEGLGRQAVLGSLWASLLFGFVGAFSINAQVHGLFPAEFAKSFPFIIAIVALAVYASRAKISAKWKGL